MTLTGWRERARCKGEPIATFFPGPGEPTTRARMICSGCPVREDCLDYALSDPTLEGWWAGTSEKERRRLRRASRRLER